MVNTIRQTYPLIKYLIHFFGIFLLLYAGSYAIVGLAAPEHFYAPFIAHYFDFTAWLRTSLLMGVKVMLSCFGFEANLRNIYSIGILHGRAIHVGYGCLGLGVMSFWTAFILANQSKWRIKIIWSLVGLFTIWMINVIRLSLLLLAQEQNWFIVLGIDHHSCFNAVTYLFIFFGMYLFAKRDAHKIIDATA
jgi:exosortase/archaeosortase family protein